MSEASTNGKARRIALDWDKWNLVEKYAEAWDATPEVVIDTLIDLVRSYPRTQSPLAVPDLVRKLESVEWEGRISIGDVSRRLEPWLTPEQTLARRRVYNKALLRADWVHVTPGIWRPASVPGSYLDQWWPDHPPLPENRPLAETAYLLVSWVDERRREGDVGPWPQTDMIEGLGHDVFDGFRAGLGPLLLDPGVQAAWETLVAYSRLTPVGLQVDPDPRTGIREGLYVLRPPRSRLIP